jgi:hypothetical protein
MSFPNVASARKSLRIHDLLVLIAVSALHLTAICPPHHPETVGLSLAMLLVGYLLWRLPELGGRGRWHDLLALPAFMALILIYFVLAFIHLFCDPTAAVVVIVAQSIALVYMSFRL